MSLQPQPQDPLIGTVLDGRYLITGKLGRGGMGIVYEGLHEQLGRAVAVKVLGAGIATEEIVVKRFLREARIASGLGHGNIVDVQDLGTLPDGRPYLVMPKINGISFAKLLERRGPHSPARVAELLRGVASALDLVHAKGLVHRDVKPENLMYVVREDGSETVMLMDFGIATLVASDAARLTAEGVVCGTPAYLAPESARGEDADHRADVYALATVAFELMTGALPFDAENQLKILPMKAFRDPPKLADIAKRPFPPAVEAVIARGLSREPEQRYRGAGEFVASLELAVEQGGVPSLEGAAALAAERVRAASDPSITPTSMLSGKPRAPTESLEMPLGASDEFDFAAFQASAGPPGAAQGATLQEPMLASPPLHGGTAPSLRPSTALPRSRSPLFAIGGAAALLLLGGLAFALLGGEGDAPEAVPAHLPANAAPAAKKPPDAIAAPAPAPAPAPPPAPAPAQPAATDPAPAAVAPEPAVPTAEPAPERTPARRTPQRAATASKPPREPAPSTPAPARTPAPTAEELLREASQTLLRGHLARAAELYEQATRRDPRSAAAFRGLGLTSERLGNKPAAIRAYKRALELAPSGAQSDTVRERLNKLQ